MKIVKKIFSISLISFLLFFAVNALAIDPPTGLSIRHIFASTPPVATVILEWTGAAENYKIYVNGVLENDFHDANPNHPWLDMDVPPGDYIYGVEAFDPITGDVSSRIEQAYTVPVAPTPVIDPPANLVATQPFPYTVTLNWTGSSEVYNIYKDGQFIGSTYSGITSFEDSHVLTGNRIYQVSSYDPSTHGESDRVATTITVTGTGTPLDAEICTGGADEDGDAMVDCADLADCSTDPACLPPHLEICTGGADEDNNGKIDCEDPACLGTPECSGGGSHQPSGDLFPIIQCGYNCPGIFPGDPDADCCTLCDAFETISRIINIILMFGFILGGMFLVVAGIIMYAGGASSGLLNKSKTIIKGVIYGLVIMLVSYLVVFTIIHFLSAGNADTLFSIKNGGFIIECTP